ncbi:MAG TPA: glucose 1-dehydrogenase [Solirubrobacterales bacterium]|nr:glucose 1-dehydrogenase [Solirubrobacterales bacterium]
MADLDGRVAVVTGGAKGIGLGICECLSEQGATVVVADIDGAAAEQSAASLPGASLAVATDVSDSGSVAALADKVKEEYGRLDILVNNAGVGPKPTPIVELSEEEWDRVMNINARGVFLVNRALVPLLVASEAGRLINISSIVGQSGFALVSQYVASKFAVTGMTQCLAHELAPNGVTVNSIHPGILETELHSNVVKLFSAIQGQSEEETWDWFKERIPLSKFQTPRDIGEMAAFLASDRASNITGAAFNVDGGWEMH